MASLSVLMGERSTSQKRMEVKAALAPMGEFESRGMTYLRDGRLSRDKERAWFADQYRHPHESKHTMGEVLDWFDRTGLSFVRGLTGPVPALLHQQRGDSDEVGVVVDDQDDWLCWGHADQPHACFSRLGLSRGNFRFDR